ncbi:hypothetical protein FIBSPDRAFT_894933 [Athelia psychrophila]|uniref:Uncharacterized protein n=1 Tax=Athelia psychrophila TaxID=1759441 RepID=A0A166F6G0_9AGAM|nr:hypothetical protein FIBSPDRAFT_894933 [Fibularhizoctonia sp. CBS 109695]
MHDRVPREPVRRKRPCPPRDEHAEGEQPENANSAEDTAVDDSHTALVPGVACVGGRARGLTCHYGVRAGGHKSNDLLGEIRRAKSRAKVPESTCCINVVSRDAQDGSAGASAQMAGWAEGLRRRCRRRTGLEAAAVDSGANCAIRIWSDEDTPGKGTLVLAIHAAQPHIQTRHPQRAADQSPSLPLVAIRWFSVALPSELDQMMTMGELAMVAGNPPEGRRTGGEGGEGILGGRVGEYGCGDAHERHAFRVVCKASARLRSEGLIVFVKLAYEFTEIRRAYQDAGSERHHWADPLK